MLARLPLVLAALLFSAAAVAAQNQYVLGVKGLACPFCAFGIEKQLNRVDGVTGVQVDIGESVVRVTMEADARLTEERARQAVDEAGFTLHSFSPAEGAPGGRDAQ